MVKDKATFHIKLPATLFKSISNQHHYPNEKHNQPFEINFTED